MAGFDIGIDLGTSTVIIYLKDKGIVLKEPSVVAMNTDTGEIVAIGDDAYLMLGRTPDSIRAVRPLEKGVISDYEMTEHMIRYFIRKVCKSRILKPRVAICVPSRITEVEKQAVKQAAIVAGARKAYLVDEPMAAAIGAGIDVSKPGGNLIVDIGGGTTDIAVITLNGIAKCESVRVAGNSFDAAIIKCARNEHRILIGEKTAENFKIRLPEIYRKEGKTLEVKGRDLLTGLPRMVSLNWDQVYKYLYEPFSSIANGIKSLLGDVEPELMGDINDRGLLMTGAGSLVCGLGDFIHDVTGIKVRFAEDTQNCVAIGTGKIFDFINVLNDGLMIESLSK